MSYSTVHANLETYEGTVSTETTISLKRRSRKIVIINDDSTGDLSYKFNISEDFATLKGTESVSMYFTTKQIIIDGSNVAYRIWVFG